MKTLLSFLLFTLFSLIVNAETTGFLNEKIVLFPIKKTELAPIVDSTIKKYNFKVGEEFKKNEILVQLDSRLYEQLYIKSKADVLRTQEAFKYLNAIYKHNVVLLKKDAIGSQELEESKIDMIKALSEKEQAKASYKISELQLNSCTIKAPFNGRVISKLENEHDYVREGQPIIEIADDNELLAVMHLPSESIKSINIGIELKFKIDETSSEVTGKVYSISGSINPGSRTFGVKALIYNEDKKLRIGMSGILLTSI